MRITLIAAIALLAAPATAAANHVQGASYAGVVTTGQGGSVTLTVSDDGTTVNAAFSGLGNVAGTCTGVGFDTGDVPIQDHSFNYLSGNGQVSASGGFGPSSVSGAAQVLSNPPCNTGSQAWTIVSPDAFLGTDLGLDVYNDSGADQTENQPTKRGESAFFSLNIKNAGVNDHRFVAGGCKSSKGFKVSYRDAFGENVTSVMTAGGYETGQIPAGSSDNGVVGLKVKVLNSAKVGKTKSCKMIVDDSHLVDVVKAKVKAKR